MVARKLVELFGCTCQLAEDGVEAVEALSRGSFEAVLMDIRMPRLDGVAATRAIRALPAPACFTPVIALTANVDPEDARTYLAAGMNGLVDKPIKPDRLLAVLSEALRRGQPGLRAAA
jgi:CheY-like chemotaxis protein